ncbi:MAG: type II secretion system protein [bacterium]|nr:type II secretion system protein [bacterium]
MTGRRGFSLVEAVVTLAIAGLVLALVFGGMSMTTNRRLVGTARKLLSDMRMVEQRARTERNCYRFVFDPAGETYSIYRYEGTVTPAPAGGGNQCLDGLAWSSAPVIKEDTADTVSRRMPARVDLVRTTFGSDVMTVSPMGNSNAGGVCLLTPSGQERWVRAEVMGRAEILDACP